MQVPNIRCAKTDESCNHTTGDGMGCMGSAVVVLEVGLRATIGLCPEHASAVIGQMVEKVTLMIPESEDRNTPDRNGEWTWSN